MAQTPTNMVVNITPAVPPDSKISPKVIAATLASLAVSCLLAVLTAVVNDPATLAQVLDVVPSWARFLIVAILPTLVTFLAGYAKRDKTRELGVAVQDHLSTPSAEPLSVPEDMLDDGDPNATPEPEGDPHDDDTGVPYAQ